MGVFLYYADVCNAFEHLMKRALYKCGILLLLLLHDKKAAFQIIQLSIGKDKRCDLDL